MSSLFKDDVDEPSYDHLNVAYDDDNDLKKGLKKGKTVVVQQDDYILGTLVVRVVAARDLEPEGGSGFLSSRSSRAACCNPYASVNFMRQTQRTSAVHSSTDPLWPRSEAMYLDVALPLDRVTYMDDASSPVLEQEEDDSMTIPEPIVTISLFHNAGSTDGGGVQKKYNPSKGKGSTTGDSDDYFLGTASLNVTPLLTGKKITMDKWLTLKGNNNSNSTVRIVCEYETSDPPPRSGDIVRLTRFCKVRDLYPVPITLAYKVQEVDRDDIILEYTTPEGWICTFCAHRFMVLCQERAREAFLDACQDELVSVTERLAYSPIIREVESAVDRVPDEGLLFVGLGAVQGAGGLLDRWMKGGVDTALGDLQYATNWDGRFTETVNLETDDDEGATAASTPLTASASVAERLAVVETVETTVPALPGMPCCPITGEPMVDPVVAADGHTYERKAISRWFAESDKSPLTGQPLPHLNLVPNYMLLSSLQEAAAASKSVEEETTTTAGVVETTTEEEAHAQDDDDDDRKMPAL